MINNIVDGICTALYGEFGDGYEIYTEGVEQGLQEPCFSIICLNPSKELFLGKRYKTTNNFMVQYFPSTDEPNNECNSVLERLFDCLELITVGTDLARGSGMNGLIVDDVLNFQVNYNLFVDRFIDDDMMELYIAKNNVRKG